MFKEDDKMCQRCYGAFLGDSFDSEVMDIASGNEMEKIDSPRREEIILAKNAAKEELNAVFQLLGMEKICDK